MSSFFYWPQGSTFAQINVDEFWGCANRDTEKLISLANREWEVAEWRLYKIKLLIVTRIEERERRERP